MLMMLVRLACQSTRDIEAGAHDSARSSLLALLDRAVDGRLMTMSARCAPGFC